MNCCFVSFFLGRGKGMNFLPVCIGSVPRLFCGIVFQGIRRIDGIFRFLLSGCHRFAFSDLLIFTRIYRFSRVVSLWFVTVAVPVCRNRFTFPISRVRTRTRIRGDRYKRLRMEYQDTIRAEKQPEVLPCSSLHGDNRHDPAVFHYHHSYPSSKSARSGRASSPSRTRL